MYDVTKKQRGIGTFIIKGLEGPCCNAAMKESHAVPDGDPGRGVGRAVLLRCQSSRRAMR